MHKDIYIVEKKIDIKAIIFVFLIVGTIVLSIFFIYRGLTKNNRLYRVENFIKDGDFENAIYTYSRLYEKSPIEKNILKLGINLYYEIMINSSDKDVEIKASEYVVSYTSQLMLISYLARKDKEYNEYLAKAYSILGRGYYNEAYNTYLQSIKYGNNKAETKILAGSLAYELGKYKDAVSMWTSVLKEKNETGDNFKVNEKVKFNLGKAYVGLNQYNRAIKYLNDLIKEIKDTDLKFDAYLFLASLYRRQKLYADSEFFYNKALEIDEKNPEVYYNIGLLYKESGRKKDALRFFRRAYWLDRNHKEAYDEIMKI